MVSPPLPTPDAQPIGRAHLTRLMHIWRAAGWPCHDAIELDLLAAGWVARVLSDPGHERLQITDTGLAQLAASRRRAQRATSPHDRLARRMARQLMDAGRIVWHELSLRAQVSRVSPMPGLHSHPQPDAGTGTDTDTDAAGLATPPWPDATLWLDEPPRPPPAAVPKALWRMARVDLFSVRHTTVRAYLQPAVHEIKVSRADLLSDLRHTAKREAYQWLCSECSYVFPAGTAEPEELPEAFGVWVVHGSVDDGRLECLRPARHQPCDLPFAVWMALAKATPLSADLDPPQPGLTDVVAAPQAPNNGP